MKVLNRIYLVLAVLLGFVGAVQCVRWSSHGSVTVGYLLNFLPATAFLLAYITSKKFPRKATHSVAILLCLASLFFWVIITLGVEMIISATSEVTDTGRYETILGDYWKNKQGLIGHFPSSIPPNAQSVYFSFLPGFLQGGAHIQLRFSLPAKEISELYDHFSQMKTMSFIGGDTNAHMNMKNGMPTTDFYTSGSGNHKFPNDFEIMIFDEVLKEENRPKGFYWNHGRSHGVAISKAKNEIVYWAESW